MKKAIYLSVFLGIIASVCTVALAAVNYITEPLILEYRQQAFAEAVSQAFPEQDDFIIIMDSETGETPSPYVNQVLQVLREGETIGFIYSKVVPGFGGPITYVMGVDPEGNYVNFHILSHSETPGFGARVVTEPDWNERVLAAGIGDEIAILSGATNTSRALLRGINSLYEDFTTLRR